MANILSKRFFYSFFLLIFWAVGLLFALSTTAGAQVQDVPQIILVKARVLKVLEERINVPDEAGNGFDRIYQKLRVEILEGEDSGKEIVVDYGSQSIVNPAWKIKEGQTVVLNKIQSQDGLASYQIEDKYRLKEIALIAAFFVLLVLILSRWKGVGSLLGMFLSLLVILEFIVPHILSGDDPLLVSIVGSVFILVTTIYLAHGFSKQTSVAVVSTAITLILTGLLAAAAVSLTSLSGLAGEDSYELLFGPTASINFKGLLLGGMIIGVLGVLDDVTTGISATVFELRRANQRLNLVQLVTSSMRVGREHISSLVNTLVLAYAGAALPIFIFIVLNPQGYPAWFILNSEFISEEIVRTLVGSIGLLFAVPITSVLASWVATFRRHRLPG